MPDEETSDVRTRTRDGRRVRRRSRPEVGRRVQSRWVSDEEPHRAHREERHVPYRAPPVGGNVMRRVKPFRLDRRTVLRAAGVSLALPWLEAMAPSHAYAQAVPAGKRVLFLYFPTGYRRGDWLANKAAGSYPDFTLPAITQALNPFKSKLTIITGMTNKPPTVGSGGDGIHARGTGCWLNCEVLNKTGLTSGITADQVIAKTVGANSCIPSLVLGVPGEQVATFAEDGYGAVYYNNISFTGPTANVQKETKALRSEERRV